MDNQARKKIYTNNKKSTKFHPVQYFPRNSGLIGLQNLGNTCYMNAALQALSNCPQLTSYMLENYDNIKPGLAKNFALLLNEIWVHSCFNGYSNQSSQVFYDYLSPTSILFGIKSTCPNFRSTAQQEDAQEFLKFFLDRIHEELKTPINAAVIESNFAVTSEQTQMDHKLNHSIVSSLNEEKDELYKHSFHRLDLRLNDHFHSPDKKPSDELRRSVNKEQQNHRLSRSINIPFNNKNANGDHLYDRLISCSLNNYILSENSKQSEITPGLGDNVNHSNGILDSPDDSDECKENDLNKLNSYSLGLSYQDLNENCDTEQENGLNFAVYSEDREENEIKESGMIYDPSEDTVEENKNGLSYSLIAENSANNSDQEPMEELNADDLEVGPQVSLNNNSTVTKKRENIVYQSIISRMFDGEILNSVQCLTCRNVSTIKETFQDLSLPIPNKDDLQQTRKMNNYLKSLEDIMCPPSIFNSDRRNDKLHKDRASKSDKKRTRVKNGIEYRRLANEEEENDDQRQLTSSDMSRRLTRMPIIKHLSKIFLYINYFFKAYLLYFLISIFYWSHNNLWGPTITLNDCLEAFFSTDELKDNNMYSCEKCNKLRNGIKYTSLVKSPELLCIHFKRFRNELMFSSKISTYVSFPIRGLSITSHTIESEQPTSATATNIGSDSTANSLDHRNSQPTRSKQIIEIYDLVSVICHRGFYSSGHYVTYALNCLDDCWYEYDDKTVRKVDENKVANCEAYVLFYKKRSTGKSDKSVESNCSTPLSTDDENERWSLLSNRSQNDNVEDDRQKTGKQKLTRSEMFNKRKYQKINGTIDFNESTDLLGDIEL